MIVFGVKKHQYCEYEEYTQLKFYLKGDDQL